MQWWKIATLLLLALASLDYGVEGKRPSPVGRGKQRARELRKEFKKPNEGTKTRRGATAEFKKKKKKQKPVDCTMSIQEDMYFTNGYVHVKPDDYMPFPKVMGSHNHCYNLQCTEFKKNKKKSSFTFNAVPSQAGQPIGSCDMCEDGGVMYAVGSVRNCKSAVPAPCWCDVCTYPNTLKYGTTKPVFVKMGMACDCKGGSSGAGGGSVTQKPGPVQPPPVQPAPKGCGVTTEQETRIVGGTAVPSLGVYPWQVRLYLTSAEGTGLCGGTLISDSWVLTAAHCIKGAKGTTVINKVDIQMGSLKQAEDSAAEVKQSMSGDMSKIIYVNSAYDTTSTVNDIAAIKLSSPVTFTKNVRPACLPCASVTTDFTGKSFALAGWGDTKFTPTGDTTDNTSPVLLDVSLPYVSNAECSKTYGTLADTQMCAGGENLNKDTCQGDSGGPMIFKSNNVNYLVGIVSFGLDSCGSKPGVYTRVSKYISWIETTTGTKFC